MDSYRHSYDVHPDSRDSDLGGGGVSYFGVPPLGLASGQPDFVDERSARASFHLLRRLGHGAFGDTFLVRHCTSVPQEPPVVMKVPRGGSSSELHRARVMLRDEAAVLRRLFHDRIILFRDFVDVPTDSFLIMEYAESGSLADLLERRSREGRLLAPAEIARIICGILQALEYIHSNGILHLDIKPANILMTPAGDVRVADFGLSRDLINSGRALEWQGTKRFMAPELVLRQSYDDRADVWSVGVLLFLLLTGMTDEVTADEVLRFQLGGRPWMPPALPGDTNPQLVALLHVMLVPNQVGRMRVAALLQSHEAKEVASMVPSSYSYPIPPVPVALDVSGEQSEDSCLCPTGMPSTCQHVPLALDSHLWSGQGFPDPPLRTSIHVLVGHAGAGKTSAARELVRRAMTERLYAGGFVWVNAESPASIVESLWNTARNNRILRSFLGERVVSGSDSEAVADGVVRYLSQSRSNKHRWLLIYDNADSLDSLEALSSRFLPSCDAHGHIIITTRHPRFSDTLSEIQRGACRVDDVTTLRPEDAALMLVQITLSTLYFGRSVSLSDDELRTHVVPHPPCPRTPQWLDGWRVLTNSALDAETAAIQHNAVFALVESNLLGGWALSIAQAARTIGTLQSIDPATRFSHFLELLQQGGARVVDALASTFRVGATMLSPPAKLMLGLIATCAPDEIPTSILLSALSRVTVPESGDAKAISDHVFTELAMLGFISPISASFCVSIHRVAQARIRRDLPVDPSIAEALSVIMCRVLETPYCVLGDSDGAGLARKCLYHCREIGASVITLAESNYLAWHGNLVQATCRAMHTLGQYQSALQMQEFVFSRRTAQLGRRHPDTLASTFWKGALIRASGDSAGAKPLIFEALTGQREVLGHHHPDTLDSLDLYATLLHSVGEYAEAETHYNLVLTGYLAIYGDTHNLTLSCTVMLATTLQYLGRLSEAEALHERALPMLKLNFGLQHPDTLRSLNNLGDLRKVQHRFAEAEELYRTALASRREYLGDTHPHTVYNVNSLVSLLIEQGALVEAETLCRETVSTCSRHLGDTHPYIRRCVDNLSSIQKLQQ